MQEIMVLVEAQAVALSIKAIALHLLQDQPHLLDKEMQEAL
jgi:hypothetical protein